MVEQSFEETVANELVTIPEVLERGGYKPGTGAHLLLNLKASNVIVTAHNADKQAYALEVLEGLKENELQIYDGDQLELVHAVKVADIDQAIAKVKASK